MRIALSLVLVASLGCTRDDAITCEKVADGMPFVLLPDRADVPSVLRWEMRGNLEGVLAYRCRTDRWNAEARTCMVRAMNRAGFDACAAKHLGVDARSAFANVLANEGLIPASRACKQAADAVRQATARCP